MRHRPRLLVLTLVVSVAAIYSGAGWGAGLPAIAGPDADAASRAPHGASWDSRPVSVIVRARPGAKLGLKRDVVRLGGTIQRDLAIINGFSATVPARAVPRLRALPGLLSATRDSRIEALGSSYAPVSDLGSPYSVTQMTGAQQYWKAGYTGKGVDVALIDSGVVPVDGLTAPGKIVNGPDLSLESQAPNLRYLDTFGHGTHMAGIIAGRANAAVAGSYDGESQRFLGMAPDARLISIKVADAHGATDVSQVIAAIDWVVQHRNDPGLNIRVLNLSYGTDTTQWYGDRPACLRGRAGDQGRHPGRGRGGQRRLLAPGHADEPCVRPARPGGRRGRVEGDARPRGRPGPVVLEQRRHRLRAQVARPGPRRTGQPHRQPARAGLVHRPDLRRRRLRHQLALPRQWHLAGGGGRLRGGGARAPAAAGHHARTS